MLPWFDSWFCAGEPDQECHGWNPDDVSTVAGFLLNSPSFFCRAEFLNKKFIGSRYSHWYFDLISFSICNISHTGGPVIPSVSKLIASFGTWFCYFYRNSWLHHLKTSNASSERPGRAQICWGLIHCMVILIVTQIHCSTQRLSTAT